MVYESLITKRAPARTDLVTTTTAAVVGALGRCTGFGDACSWDMECPACPQQGNGYDCGVYVMVFADLLSMSVQEIVLDAHHMRDNLLLSLILGRIAHFPTALQG